MSVRALAIVVLAVSCYRGGEPAPAPAVVAAPHPPLVAAPRPGELYALDDALDDVLSGPLVHIGTGDWFGLFRIHACAYRNDRVIVVNVYCTANEMSSFGLVVLSPARGRTYIYAEAKAPISTLARGDYFTFKAESSPPLVDDKLAALDLAFSYAELRAWDERRYYRNIPGCFYGVEINRPLRGCLQGLDARQTTWLERNQHFLDDPPEPWYRIVKQLRARAASDSKP